jgi:hypothetical protein
MSIDTKALVVSKFIVVSEYISKLVDFFFKIKNIKKINS